MKLWVESRPRTKSSSHLCLLKRAFEVISFLSFERIRYNLIWHAHSSIFNSPLSPPLLPSTGTTCPSWVNHGLWRGKRPKKDEVLESCLASLCSRVVTSHGTQNVLDRPMILRKNDICFRELRNMKSEGNTWVSTLGLV